MKKPPKPIKKIATKATGSSQSKTKKMQLPAEVQDLLRLVEEQRKEQYPSLHKGRVARTVCSKREKSGNGSIEENSTEEESVVIRKLAWLSLIEICTRGACPYVCVP